ncbi:MAG: hypothetical protein IPP47_24750 [Bryobacterales bacterium]|nr:hypothetical protein [Bryobacterales bacterium]
MASSTIPATVPPPDQVMAELERLLDSRWLRESHQLRRLLRHIVEETIAGRADGLKEYSLGLEVFHRSGDYDPRNDAIVRVQASLLRKKIQSYYENEGQASVLRIDLPRGGYVPLIAFRQLEPDEPPAIVPVPAARRFPLWAAFLAGAVSAAALTAALLHRPPDPALAPIAAPSIWAQFLLPGVPTIVSFGVPLFYNGGDGLYLRDVRVNQPSDPRGQFIIEIQRILKMQFRPHDDVYTGIGEALGTHEVTRFLEERRQPVRILNSHFLAPSEIAGKNLVVISSLRFQTLLQSLDLPSAFRYNGDGAGSIEPNTVLPGEKASYAATGFSGVATTYSLVSLWPGTQLDRRILRLGGMHSWSTFGAVQYILDPAHQAVLQKSLDADPVDGPRGRKSPYFEVLLRLEGKDEQVRSVQYVTHRYLQAKPVNQ